MKFRPFLLLILAACTLGLSSSLWSQTAPATTSSLRELLELKLNTPVPVEKQEVTAIPGYDELMVSRNRWAAKAEGVEINIEGNEFKDISIVSLEGAANGSADAVSKLEGVSSPQVTISEATVPGADSALRVSFKAQRYGKELCIESLYAIKGSRLWTVICTFENTGPRPKFIGETVVKSVRFE